MNTKQVLDQIFKDPKVQYQLTEFDALGKPVDKLIDIYEKTVTSGRDTGKKKYFMKSFVPFSSGKEEVQVYVEDGKASPEEIVRQLWVYKLINHYGYKQDEIELEKSIQFGTEVGTKAADIVVYRDDKETPKVIVEVKKPKRKDGIEQLKSYLNAEGSPIGVWSNGSDKIVLYRPYPKKFDDTLTEIPKRDQEPKDVLEAPLTLGHLDKNFDFKKIILDLEELVLGSSGVDVFNEIFKIIYAKIWDEKEAEENPDRENQEVTFKKFVDPELTYERINHLFKRASEEWPGIFKDHEEIELRKDHLQVCIGPIERKRFLGSSLRIMDDAFEYLLPTEAKKKKGQFFTPRYVIDMCVRMLNPKRNEYVIDTACGSAGFLVHAMDWIYPATTSNDRALRKMRYASKYLWGIDFEKRAAQTARALMLIAGDGHTKVFGPDVDSLEPRTWFGTASGNRLINELRSAKLTATAIPQNATLDEDTAWEYFRDLKFDVVLTNPPFAGEVKDRKQLMNYELAKPALRRAKNKQPKEERDVLFIERNLRFLKPGGRAAIVLPQGKFNNSSLAFIREWILHKCRLLAVVGLHQNTFKPHTGTKTSILFVQKYTQQEIAKIEAVQQEVAAECPDYGAQIGKLVKKYRGDEDVPEDKIPENVAEVLLEEFGAEEPEMEVSEDGGESDGDQPQSQEERIDAAQQNCDNIRGEIIRAKEALMFLDDEVEGRAEKLDQEYSMVAEERPKYGKELKKKGKEEIKTLKKEQKEKRKKLNKQLKALNKALEQAAYELKLLTNKGRLELLLQNEDAIARLKERYIDAEVAKRLDYPIFMAVSEQGGKNNSGEYEYLTDEDGNLVLDANGNAMIKQDLVNYAITKEQLEEGVEKITDEECGIAEAFVKWARNNQVRSWDG